VKTATVAELRNHFPRVLRWIEEGEEVQLTRRGELVALLTPPKRTKTRTLRMPDFAGIRREVFGDDLKGRRLSAADSAFIRDRGKR
jgi:antitoxin (DNA-binding transcriptional repressor) of toxin-antitoxin stability system